MRKFLREKGKRLGVLVLKEGKGRLMERPHKEKEGVKWPQGVSKG